MNKKAQRAIKFSAQTILEIPFSIRIGAAILNTSVFGTLSTLLLFITRSFSKI